MYKYTPIQTENSVKKAKGILYCNHLPENGQIIGKVDLSDATVDKNAAACLCVNETDYTVMPMETEDDANKMKGFIPVSDKNSPDIYYLAIEKIHRLPLWICGLVPLAAVSIVALSVGIPAFLRPENKPQAENNPVIVADNDVTPTPIPTPARETIAPSATETPQAAQEDTTPEKKEDRIPDKGKDQIAVVPVADIKTPAPTEAPKVEEDTKKDDDTKTTSTPNSTVTPAPTATPHVHTYVVEEQAATCTNLGFYKKYCSECGYVVADHTCTALGHTNSVASVSNMTYPDGMAATYVCDRCNETVKDNFDYTAGIYKADGSLLYTYDALEELFDWNLSTTPVKEQMDAHTELADGRILVLPSWAHLSEVAEASGKTEPLHGGTEGEPCFYQCNLTEVILPDDTPYLGNWFYDTNIEKLYLPDSITEYKGQVNNNDNLHYIRLSANTPVVNNFFNNPNIWTIIIPEGVTTLSGYTFSNIHRNENHPLDITLPRSIIYFHDSFSGSKIRTLTIPGTVKSVPEMTSWDFEYLVLEEGVEEIAGYFHSTSNSQVKKVFLPSSLKKVGDVAFAGQLELDEFSIKEGLVDLGQNTFAGSWDMKNMEKIILPNSLELTGHERSLINSSTLNLVVYPDEVDYFGSGNGPYISGGTNSSIPTRVIMPSVMHNISSAYLNFPSMEEIVIPGGDYSNVSVMFSGCKNLKKITITGEITGMQGQFFHTAGSQLTDIYYYGSEESMQRVVEAYVNLNENNKPEDAFGNATVHYMTGTPPTRGDLMKEYGVEEGVYGLYSDKTYANAVERHKTENASITEKPVEILQLSETKLFNSTKERDPNSVKTEAHIHSLSIDEKTPTCTEDGYYRVTCSACGEVLADHVCKKLGHNMQMIDPEDNTADIMVPRFKCNRCDYTESTNHTHNWIAKGYENMTYPNGGDSIYICETCLTKKTEHTDAVPGLYTEAGNLLYDYDQLEDKFDWNLSTTSVKRIMDAHTELESGRILLLPSWQHLSEVATESGANCGLIRGEHVNNPCFKDSLLSEVILPDDCNEAGDWFCYSNVTKIELPDSITKYNHDYGCGIYSAPKLKYLKLSAGATDLTDLYAGSNYELEEIIIPEGIEKLGKNTFAGNDKLKSITLPSTLTDIGDGAFSGTGIEYLEIPSGVKEINSNLGNKGHSIAYMEELRTLVLNDGLEKIGFAAFTSLRSLETINIPSTVTEMGYGVFSGLRNLKNVTLENGLSVMGEKTFENCSSIEQIIIPNTVKTIPDNLFTGADSLKLIALPEEVDSIGGNDLFSCGNNSDELKIIMPITVKEWRKGAAFCSSKLKEIVLPGNVDYPVGLVGNDCGLEKVVITSEPNSIAYGAFGNLHNADIYYYGSKESVEKFNTDAGNKDVFYQADNNNRLHYMIGTPPSREDQMNGIDYDSLEEATTQSITSEVPVAAEEASLPSEEPLPVTEEITDTNTSESTDNTEETKPLKSVSDGDAK